MPIALSVRIHSVMHGACLIKPGRVVCACSPFDDNTAAQPRLRALPPAPQWLKKLLGADADTPTCCTDDPDQAAYSGLQQPLSGNC